MKRRSSDILKHLANRREKNFTIEQLKKQYGISEKALRKDLEDINFFLRENGIPRIRLCADGKIELFLAEKDKEVLDLLKNIDNLSYVMNKEERKIYIMLRVLKQNGYITMEQLADILCVTRITILNDMIEVTQRFQEAGLEIESKPGKGIRAAGEEYQIRVLIAGILQENNFEDKQEFGLSSSFYYKLLREVFCSYDLEAVSLALKHAEKQLNIQFTGRGFRKTLFYLYAMLNRMDKDTQAGLYTIKSSNFGCADGIIHHLGSELGICIQEEEIVFLHRFMKEQNVLIQKQKDGEKAEIQTMVANFLYHVSEDLQVSLYDDYSLFEFISVHLEQMQERVKSGEKPIVNAVLDEIKEQYPVMWESVRKNLHIIESFYSIQISLQEMSYIVMHLCADIERRNDGRRRLATMIIAPESIASGHFLKVQLDRYFNFDIKKIITINHIAEEDETEVDFLISTVVLPRKKVPVLVLPPILDFEAFNQIQLTVFRILQNKKTTLKRELEKQTDFHDFRLYQTISPQLIRLRIECDDCREALREGGTLLSEQGYAWPGFVDSLLRILDENGPYFVMRKGVAIAHTVSPETSYESAVSLVTIQNGVEFGHACHDPVYVLFCLNIRDAHSYVKLLNDILKISSSTDFLEKMMEIDDCKKAYEQIKRMCLE